MTNQSKKTNINAPAEKIFVYISNFNNFGGLLPEQVEGWRSTENECFFQIKGLTEMGLLIKEKTPYSKITIVNHPDVSLPLSFTLVFDLESSASGSETQTQVTMETDVNPMMAMMLKKPLATFVDTLVDKLKEKMEMC